jgi:hypothetical protein
MALSLLVPIFLLCGESLLHYREKLEEQLLWAQSVPLRLAVENFLLQREISEKGGELLRLEIRKNGNGELVAMEAEGANEPPMGAWVRPMGRGQVFHCVFFINHHRRGCLLSLR